MKAQDLSVRQINTLISFFKDRFSTENFWDAIHDEIRDGEDPKEVLKRYRRNSELRLFWRLHGCKNDRETMADMAKWLEEAIENAVEVK